MYPLSHRERVAEGRVRGQGKDDTMNSSKKILIGALFMLACAPPDAFSIENNRDNSSNRQMQTDKDKNRVRLDLREVLRDRECWPALFRDPDRMHNLLEQSELRREMLKCPRFMRQMMQNVDMRQELLHNELMVQEMLRNRDIHREINRNQKMLEELEKNKIYRQINKDHQTDILEELLTELAVSGVFYPRR